MTNVSDKSCRENQNTHFTFNCFFIRISCRLWDNVEKILSSVQREPSRAIRTETGMTKLCAILRTRLETRSVPAQNHRESYKLVFKIQRWLNCRTGTKHGSFTGIPIQPISHQQRQRYQTTDPERILHAETQFSESANIYVYKCV
jgi:hypothetical protein